jgi:hypothetical protein
MKGMPLWFRCFGSFNYRELLVSISFEAAMKYDGAAVKRNLLKRYNNICNRKMNPITEQ